MLDLSLLGQISDTALTADKAIDMQQSGLPNTFVPGRNLLFLTFAATIAYRRQLKQIVGGMCETDYSGSITSPRLGLWLQRLPCLRLAPRGA